MAEPTNRPLRQTSLPRTLRVLMTADLNLFPVPPVRYGATERLVATYSCGLRDRGHTIDLIAKTGSQRFNGELFTPAAPSNLYLSRAVRKICYQPLSLWAARHADVVHCHSRADYLWSLLKTSKPIVVHFHNDARQQDVDWLLSRRKRHLRFVGISQSQIENIAQRDLFDVVYSVLPVETLPFRATPDNPPFLVYLGRVTHNKGADIAVEVARRAGIPLKIIGPVHPNDAAFYRERIAPYLGPHCVHLGEVTDEEKLRVLSGATAMVFPMRWKEPMGLVMLESLACGTPVIVANRASAPELVTHGKTGYLCDSTDDYLQAVRLIDRIDRAACRHEAETRFDVPTMIDAIEAVYSKAIA